MGKVSGMVTEALMWALPLRVWITIGIVVGVLLLTFGCTALVLVPVSSQVGDAGSALHEQCDDLVGPDPDVTETERTPAPTPTSIQTVAPEDIPTEAPFAKFTVPPGDSSVSDWMRSCAAVISSAPWVPRGMVTATSAAAVQCASDLLSGPAITQGGGGDMAGVTRSVIYAASVAAVTGRCDPVAAADVPQPAAGNGCDSSTAVISGRGRGAVVLPMTIAAQVICGSKVSRPAVSAGDLVFWDFRKSGPAQVGIAAGPAGIVAPDPGTGKLTQQVFPSAKDVRVKRVLGGSS